MLWQGDALLWNQLKELVRIYWDNRTDNQNIELKFDYTCFLNSKILVHLLKSRPCEITETSIARTNFALTLTILLLPQSPLLTLLVLSFSLSFPSLSFSNLSLSFSSLSISPISLSCPFRQKSRYLTPQNSHPALASKQLYGAKHTSNALMTSLVPFQQTHNLSILQQRLHQKEEKEK